MFLCSGYVFRHEQSFKRFGWNALKLELFKDKILVYISFLWHIHHENRPIFSAFNPIWTGLLEGSSGPGGGWFSPTPHPPQYLGLYLSFANKTWQLYKTNQNKVIDIKKLCWHCRMLLTASKIKGGTPKYWNFQYFYQKLWKC